MKKFRDFSPSSSSEIVVPTHTNSWAVQLEIGNDLEGGLALAADQIASKYGLINLGRVSHPSILLIPSSATIVFQDHKI